MFIKINAHKATIFYTSAIFILCAISLFIFDHYSSLYTHKKVIKQAILEGRDPSELVHFEFTPEEVQELDWEHSREFKYHNQMYDVVKKQEIDGKVHYWCWKDDKESEMHAQLEKLTHYILGNSFPNEKGKIQVEKLKNSLFNDSPSNPTFGILTQKTHLLSNYHFSVTSNETTVESPPPEIN